MCACVLTPRVYPPVAPSLGLVLLNYLEQLDDYCLEAFGFHAVQVAAELVAAYPPRARPAAPGRRIDSGNAYG
jgi:hypothetical protein